MSDFIKSNRYFSFSISPFLAFNLPLSRSLSSFIFSSNLSVSLSHSLPFQKNEFSIYLSFHVYVQIKIISNLSTHFLYIYIFFLNSISLSTLFIFLLYIYAYLQTVMTMMKVTRMPRRIASRIPTRAPSTSTSPRISKVRQFYFQLLREISPPSWANHTVILSLGVTAKSYLT